MSTINEVVDVYIVPPFWSCLVAIGMVLNGHVMYLMARYGEGITSRYVIGVTLVDLVSLVTVVPMTMMHYAMTSWETLGILCKFNMFTIHVVILGGSVSISALIVEFWATPKASLKKIAQGGRSSTLLKNVPFICIWAVSALICVPYGSRSVVTKGMCRLAWTRDEGNLHVAILVVLSYCLPVVMGTVGHWVHIRRRRRNDRHCSAADSEASRQSRTLVEIAVTIVPQPEASEMSVSGGGSAIFLVFGIFMLPIQILMLWMQFDLNFPRIPALYVFKMAAHTLSYSTWCITPIILVFTPEVRTALYKWLNQLKLQKETMSISL